MRQQQTFQALGSAVALTFVHERDAAFGDGLFARLRQHIEEFERRFSRFLPDSELTHFNQRAGEKVPVSAAFRALLTTAKDAATETGGVYNPFVLPALQRAGYIGSWPAPETRAPATDFSARAAASPEAIVIGPDWARIPQDSAIDFGGIGKGYLLDELATMLEGQTLTGYWLSLGGDIVCAGHDVDGQPWHVGVQNAQLTDKIIDTISNKNGDRLAIATSGTSKRRGVHDGRAWHHLIDPRTGQPAHTDIITATVTAARATTADVYAKCVVIAGANWAEAAKRAGHIQTLIVQTGVNA